MTGMIVHINLLCSACREEEETLFDFIGTCCAYMRTKNTRFARASYRFPWLLVLPGMLTMHRTRHTLPLSASVHIYQLHDRRRRLIHNNQYRSTDDVKLIHPTAAMSLYHSILIGVAYPTLHYTNEVPHFVCRVNRFDMPQSTLRNVFMAAAVRCLWCTCAVSCVLRCCAATFTMF